VLSLISRTATRFSLLPGTLQCECLDTQGDTTEGESLPYVALYLESPSSVVRQTSDSAHRLSRRANVDESPGPGGDSVLRGILLDTSVFV
jgi:hypothetical protein